MCASRQDLDLQHAILMTGWAFPERRADQFLIALTTVLSTFRRLVVLAPACPVIFGIVLASLLGSGWPGSRKRGRLTKGEIKYAKVQAES